MTSLFVLKLASSGLTPEDAETLGIKLLPPRETAAIAPQYPCHSIYFTYHDLAGGPRSDVQRVRLLDPAPLPSFGAPERPPKYYQKAGSPSGVYLPKTIDWATIAKDPQRTILITEGELKAACAAKHGFACLGLPGVTIWRDPEDPNRLLPDLEAIVWLGRDVVLCFDSDAATNPLVAQQLARLIQELCARGAKPRVASLPPLPETPKTGIDDFIVSQGREAFLEIVDSAALDPLTQALWGYNARYVFVAEAAAVYDRQLDVRYDERLFRLDRQVDIVTVTAVVQRDHGQGSRVVTTSNKTSVVKEWFKWPLRARAQKYVYEPGQEWIYRGNINRWTGWGCTPAKGDVTPFLDHIAYLFEGADDTARIWLTDWMLWPMRNPGAKMFSAVHLWSRQQGVGKSLLGDTLCGAYGSNATTIDQEELDGNFNDWASAKQLVFVDELQPHEGREKAAKLKGLITRPTLRINAKFEKAWEARNCVNLFLCSNHENAIYIEPQDRRYFVHEVTATKRKASYYDRYTQWRAGSGLAALLYYAQHEHIFADGFDIHAPPPITESKARAAEAGLSDVDAWVAALLDSPDSALRIGREAPSARDLYTTAELLARYRAHHPHARDIAVNRFGVHLQMRVKPLRLKVSGEMIRLYPVRHAARWLKATPAEIRDHLHKTGFEL